MINILVASLAALSINVAAQTGAVSNVGGSCGGNIPNPPTCAQGLTCQQTNPDMGGTCIASSTNTTAGQWGQTCGGNGPNPVTCTMGLVCMTIKTRPDNSGVCVETASGPFATEGQTCMSNTPHPATCVSGLTCQPDGTGAGKCVQPTTSVFANLGDPCGNGTSTCIGGTVCQIASTYGTPGICVPAPPGACGNYCQVLANAATPAMTASSLGLKSAVAMMVVAVSASMML